MGGGAIRRERLCDSEEALLKATRNSRTAELTSPVTPYTQSAVADLSLSLSLSISATALCAFGVTGLVNFAFRLLLSDFLLIGYNRPPP